MDTNELIEKLSKEVHNAWWEKKKQQGFHAPLDCPHKTITNQYGKYERVCEKCHPDMYPYNELAENIKDYDRTTVMTVLQALDKKEIYRHWIRRKYICLNLGHLAGPLKWLKAVKKLPAGAGMARGCSWFTKRVIRKEYRVTNRLLRPGG